MKIGSNAGLGLVLVLAIALAVLIKTVLPKDLGDLVVFVVGAALTLLIWIGFSSEEEARKKIRELLPKLWAPIALGLSAAVVSLLVYHLAITPQLRLDVRVYGEDGPASGQRVTARTSGGERTAVSNGDGLATIRLKASDVREAFNIAWTVDGVEQTQLIEWPQAGQRHEARIRVEPNPLLEVKYIRLTGLALSYVNDGHVPPGLDEVYENWPVVETPAFQNMRQLFQAAARPASEVIENANAVRAVRISQRSGVSTRYIKAFEAAANAYLPQRLLMPLQYTNARVSSAWTDAFIAAETPPTHTVANFQNDCMTVQGSTISNRIVGLLRQVQAREVGDVLGDRSVQGWVAELRRMGAAGDVGEVSWGDGSAYFNGREPALEVLVLTNKSNAAMRLGEFSYVVGGIRSVVTWPPQILSPGQTVVVPTNLLLLNVVRGEDGFTIADVQESEEHVEDPCSRSEAAIDRLLDQNPAARVQLSFGRRTVGFAASAYFAAEAAYDEANARDVVLGGRTEFRTVQIDGVTVPIRPADFESAGVELGYQIGG
jgi:hypothetical protein